MAVGVLDQAGKKTFSIPVAPQLQPSPVTYGSHENSITVANCEAWPKGVDLPCPRPNTFLEEAAAVATMLLAFGWVVAVPVCFALPLYLAICHDVQMAAAAACILVGLVIMPPPQDRLPMFLRLGLWNCWRRYFSMRAITPPLPYLTKSRHYMLVQFPHACCPLACWLVLGMAGLQQAGLPMPVIRATIADVMFSLPGIKHVLAWGGCHPAKRGIMLRILRKASLGCLPEGIAGVFHGATPQREQVYLLRRKGFVRIAIQAGADIVPVYHLGQSQLLTFRGFSRASRRCRITLGMFWGRFGLPLPRKQPIVTLVAPPIAVVQQDDPSREYVDAIHAQVVDAVQQLYSKHRHVLPGWESRDLTIV